MLFTGTLYCAKGNYEFGISRVIKSLEPYNKKLGTDTWFYAKRCFLSLIENLAKHMISVRDSVIQVNYGKILIISAAMFLIFLNINNLNKLSLSFSNFRNVFNFWSIAKFMEELSKLLLSSHLKKYNYTEERIL